LSDAKLDADVLLKAETIEPANRSEFRRSVACGDIPALPAALGHLGDAIRESRVILERQPEWHEEDALVCDESTWRRAVQILVAHATAAWETTRVAIKPPVISAGPEGSVDLYWPPQPYGLLLNIPASPSDPATYYGDNRDKADTNKTSGKLTSEDGVDPGVLMWLAHMA